MGKYFWWGGIGAAGLLVAYLIYKKSKTAGAAAQPTTATGGAQPSGASVGAGGVNLAGVGLGTADAGGAVDTYSWSKVLKRGDSGQEVRILQNYINQNFLSDPMARNTLGGLLVADGNFGAKTEAALYAWKGVRQISLNSLYGISYPLASIF